MRKIPVENAITCHKQDRFAQISELKEYQKNDGGCKFKVSHLHMYMGLTGAHGLI